MLIKQGKTNFENTGIGYWKPNTNRDDIRKKSSSDFNKFNGGITTSTTANENKQKTSNDLSTTRTNEEITRFDNDSGSNEKGSYYEKSQTATRFGGDSDSENIPEKSTSFGRDDNTKSTKFGIINESSVTKASKSSKEDARLLKGNNNSDVESISSKESSEETAL